MNSNPILRAAKLASVAVTILLVSLLFPSASYAASDQRVDAHLNNDDGPWTADLVGFDLSKVKSVTYWLRDGKEQWHRIGPITHAPFQADLEWWRWDTSADEALTAHVTVQGAGWFGTDSEVSDPGGWHWISKQHVSPAGTTTVRMNGDGTAAAEYRPDRQASVVRRVDFWLRNAQDQWVKAGSTDQAVDGLFAVRSLAGTTPSGWNGTEAAVSVHVIWPAGPQLTDPSPWVWSDHFLAAPTAPVTPPMATAPPATQASVAAPPAVPAAAPPAAAPPAAAPPAAAPPPPVRNTCGTPTNPWNYNFCGGSVISTPPQDFCNYFNCIPSFWRQTNGYVIQCADGTYSHSGGRSGSCSSHQGDSRTLYQ